MESLQEAEWGVGGHRDEQPGSSEYGGQTVLGPAWPDADEEVVGTTADRLDTMESTLRDSSIPRPRF